MITVEFVPPDTKGLGAEAIELLRPGLVEFVRDAVMDLANRMKVRVGRAGLGRLYRRGKSGRTHRASAPGDSPARDMGSYVNSWDSEVSDSRDAIEGRAGSFMWAKRGAWLEFGTRFMRPRPHVTPVMEEWTHEINAKIERLNAGG